MKILKTNWIFLSLIAFFLGIQSGAIVSFANPVPQVELEVREDKTVSTSLTEGNELTEESSSISKDKLIKGTNLLLKLKKQLSAQRENFGNLSYNLEETKEKLEETGERVKTLDGQVQFLTREVKKTERKIDNTKYSIAEKETEIEKTYEEIEIKKIEIDQQKRDLSYFLKLLYFNENEFFDFEQREPELIKMLLTERSVGTILREKKYLSIIEKETQNILEILGVSLDNLHKKENYLENARDKLEQLKTSLITSRQQQKEQEESKKMLLDQTKGEEKIYQELLTFAKEEQLRILHEINILRSNVSFVQGKLDSIKDDFNPEEYEKLVEERLKQAELQGLSSGSFNSLSPLNWPVSPNRGLSALFMDKGYEGVFGIRHYAIDVPVPQGTPIKSPANGVVRKVRDAGMGYSYLILSHPNGLDTLFGHIYAFNVEEGDVVRQGEVVALTGGVPGTKGAGLITTGAHLHFEVIKGGKRVDPMLFLPIEMMPVKYIPQKYLDVMEIKKVKRTKE